MEKPYQVQSRWLCPLSSQVGSTEETLHSIATACHNPLRNAASPPPLFPCPSLSLSWSRFRASISCRPVFFFLLGAELEICVVGVDARADDCDGVGCNGGETTSVGVCTMLLVSVCGGERIAAPALRKALAPSAGHGCSSILPQATQMRRNTRWVRSLCALVVLFRRGRTARVVIPNAPHREQCRGEM